MQGIRVLVSREFEQQVNEIPTDGLTRRAKTRVVPYAASNTPEAWERPSSINSFAELRKIES